MASLTVVARNRSSNVWKLLNRILGYGCPLVGISTVVGCSWFRASLPGREEFPHGAALPGIVQHQVAERPRLVTLVREGDPEAAVALVLGRFASVDQSVEVAALFAARLAQAAPRAEVIPRSSGITIVAPLESAADAAQVIGQLDRVVRTPVGSVEATGASYRSHLERLRRYTALHVSPAERALCAGESGKDVQASPRLEQLRALAFSEVRARFASVGRQAVVSAVDTAIRRLAPWPKGPSVPAYEPNGSHFHVVHSGGSTPHVEVVWWTRRTVLGITAARELARKSSDFRGVLDALPAAMRLDAVALTPQPSGTCLSLSLSQVAPEGSPTADDAVATSHVALEMLRQLGEQEPRDEMMTLAVVEQWDPRRAAELAAQLSLSRDATRGEDHFDVEIATATGQSPTLPQQKLLAAAVGAHGSTAPIPLTRAPERGQSILHALVASPCASWSETSKTAGATGLMLRTLALRFPEVDGVSIEPWVSSDGAGLMAHAARRSPNENPDEQARRLGDALGRVLATTKFEPALLWSSRQELLSLLGPGPRPALWTAIQSLSPRYPGVIIPDGQFSSVETLSTVTLNERRSELLRLPLRMAVLETEGAGQGELARTALSKWISLLRVEMQDCPTIAKDEPFAPSESRIESRTPDPNDAGLTVAMPLSGSDENALEHGLLLERSMGGATGWLAQRLRASNLVATVDAKVIGGSKRRGLLVVIGTQANTLDAAAAAVVGLFEELGSGIVPPLPPLEATIAQLELSERARRVDPRVRLEDLWLSRQVRVPLSEASFRSYLKRAFATPKRLTQVRSLRIADSVPSGRTNR